MAVADDKVAPPAEETEGVILLTEVAGEPLSEVVLEISAGKPDLESLFHPEEPSASPPETPGTTEADEDLRDFLASLKDLPEDLGTPAIPVPVLPAEPEAAVQGEAMLSWSEAQLKEIVREVVQEVVAKLTQEMPQIAGEALERKIDARRRTGEE